MRKIVIAVLCISMSALALTGCSENISDGISENHIVASNISNYIKERYGADVVIDHTFMQGGANNNRDYIADVQIGDESYIFRGMYDSNGFYERTTDTVINQVVDKYITERTSNILSKLFDDYSIKVSSNVEVDDNINFGKIPTYDDIVNCDNIGDTSYVNIIGVVYCDTNNMKASLRAKGDVLASILDESIPSNASLYLVDNTYKEVVSKYIDENDVVSFLAIVNSVEQTENIVDCCKNVLKYSSVNKERLIKDGPMQFISKIEKKSKDDTEKIDTNNQG